MPEKHWIEKAAQGSLIDWVHTTLQYARQLSDGKLTDALLDTEAILHDHDILSLSDSVDRQMAQSVLRDTFEHANKILALNAKFVLNVVVEDGVVQDVENLPEGWSYTIEDHDVQEDEFAFHNYYHCDDCDESWEAANCDSAHNDRCPKCDHEIEPYKSVEFVDGEKIGETDWTATGPAQPGE